MACYRKHKDGEYNILLWKAVKVHGCLNSPHSGIYKNVPHLIAFTNNYLEFGERISGTCEEWCEDDVMWQTIENNDVEFIDIL